MNKILAVSKNQNMLKIEDTKEAKGYVWYFLSDEVQKYATSIGIKAGDVVEFKAEEIRGEDTIIFLKKEGGATSEFKCEKCGKPLKDNKYKTCYDCSMKAREEEAKSPEAKDRQDSIVRQCILKCSVEAVKTMGTFKDVPELCGMIESIFDRLTKKFNS
jgi:bifunctional DNA-binding transcriptional regulator/antitoxin component of YhaV-PrlF toxin-antitoxin module